MDLVATTACPQEKKLCGHWCFPSSVDACCQCSDLRPDAETYAKYEDGKGLVRGKRNDYYCPICNPQNYSEWIQRIEKVRFEKLEMKKLATIEFERKEKEYKEERKLISELTEKKEFVYKNGDVYIGSFNKDGKKEGFGKLSSSAFYYEGFFLEDEHHGYGEMVWLDNIKYQGMWSHGKMKGKGRYEMSDGTVLEGEFDDDEFSVSV